jgi:uncharacterized protein (TIGR03435 family)
VASRSDCSPEGMAAMRAAMAGGGPGVIGGRGAGPAMMMPAMPPLGEVRPCTSMRSGGQISAGGATLAELTRMMQQNTGRIVQDRTGLSGRFDFDLTFTPDPALSGRGMGGGLPPDPSRPAPPVNPDAISIFAAVQEQLGLKLEAARGPVEVVVIERIEKASEN